MRKPWWKSVTVWLNGAVVAVELVNSVQPFITNPSWHTRLAGFVAVTNVLIRLYKTRDPILAPPIAPDAVPQN